MESYGRGRLGTHKEVLTLIKAGQLDLGITTGISPIPEFQVISIPYFFSSDEVAWWVFDNSSFWKDLMEKMRKEIGLRCLAMSQNGVRNFTNNVRPIRTPEDMKGYKFRVMQSPIYLEMVKAIGGKPMPVAWEKLFATLKAGIVDGQENPEVVIKIGGLHKLQKYLTLDGHVWSEDMLLTNDKLFQSLPSDIQRIIEIAARQRAVAGRAIETTKSKITDLEIVSKDWRYTPLLLQKKNYLRKPAKNQ